MANQHTVRDGYFEKNFANFNMEWLNNIKKINKLYGDNIDNLVIGNANTTGKNLITFNDFKSKSIDQFDSSSNLPNMVKELRAFSNKISFTHEYKPILLFLVEMIELFCEGLYINNFLSNFLKRIKKRNTGKDEIDITQTIQIPEGIKNKKQALQFVFPEKNISNNNLLPTNKGKDFYNQFIRLNITEPESMNELLNEIEKSYIYIIGHIRTDMATNEDSIYGNLNTLYFTDLMNYNNNYRKDPNFDENNEEINNILSTLKLEVSKTQKGGSRKLSKSKRERLLLKLRKKIKKNKTNKNKEIK